MNIPWKHIFTSVPVWALTIYTVGTSFGTVALANETPIYMNKVLGFDIQWVSILIISSIPETEKVNPFLYNNTFCIFYLHMAY